MIVNVHVDRLVVEGPDLRPADGRRLAEALTRELTRLLSSGEPGAGLRTGRSERRLDAPPLASSAWSSPSALGRDAARSIHRGLS